MFSNLQTSEGITKRLKHRLLVISYLARIEFHKIKKSLLTEL